MKKANVMKRSSFIILNLLVLSLLFSACSVKPNSPIKYERRFGKYFETEEKKVGGMIDLSEGPKLRYEGRFGPKDLNFDFKIINPY